MLLSCHVNISSGFFPIIKSGTARKLLSGAYLSTDQSAIADFFQPCVENDLSIDSVVPAPPTALKKIPEIKAT